jgi:hypothetical protein
MVEIISSGISRWRDILAVIKLGVMACQELYMGALTEHDDPLKQRRLG